MMNGAKFKDPDGESWVRVGDGCSPYVLAVKAEGDFPAQVMMVCDAELKRAQDAREAGQVSGFTAKDGKGRQHTNCAWSPFSSTPVEEVCDCGGKDA